MPVVGASVGVKRSKQSPVLNDLTYSSKAAHRAFLSYEEHRIVLIGRIIPGQGQRSRLLRCLPLAGARLMSFAY